MWRLTKKYSPPQRGAPNTIFCKKWCFFSTADDFFKKIVDLIEKKLVHADDRVTATRWRQLTPVSALEELN